MKKTVFVVLAMVMFSFVSISTVFGSCGEPDPCATSLEEVCVETRDIKNGIIYLQMQINGIKKKDIITGNVPNNIEVGSFDFDYDVPDDSDEDHYYFVTVAVPGLNVSDMPSVTLYEKASTNVIPVGMEAWVKGNSYDLYFEDEKIHIRYARTDEEFAEDGVKYNFSGDGAYKIVIVY